MVARADEDSRRERTLAVVFAGGVGRRMHNDATPKQFLELHGKPVIVWTLETFENHPAVDSIAVACVEGWIDRLRELVGRFGLRKVRHVVPGGTTDITRNVEAARSAGGAVTTAPAAETIAVLGPAGRIGSLVPRENCRLARAPQTFRLGDLLAAHRAADAAGKDDVIDTVTLMREAGFPPPVAVEGPPENIKITTPQDFLLFRQIVEAREVQRGWKL